MTFTVQKYGDIDLSRAQMTELGIKPGHQAKIVKRIKE